MNGFVILEGVEQKEVTLQAGDIIFIRETSINIHRPRQGSILLKEDEGTNTYIRFTEDGQIDKAAVLAFISAMSGLKTEIVENICILY